ncbi:MAG: hypothetical protein RL662_1141 [Bacteroidota bacterium]|jgi:hypothetical protein
MKKALVVVTYLLILFSCKHENKEEEYNIADQIAGGTRLKGKEGNGDFLYITAGSRLYSIGNQKGLFPEIGFHVPGEMGGIWQQPLKLLDGFRVSLTDSTSNQTVNLDNCSRFTSYPLASQFEYALDRLGLNIKRTDFVPDDSPVLAVEYKLTNTTQQNKNIKFRINIDSDLSPVWLGDRSGMLDGPDLVENFDVKKNSITFKDSLSTWYASVLFEKGTLSYEGQEKSQFKGNGVTAKLEQNIQISPQQTYILRFYIGGSMTQSIESINIAESAKNKIEKLVIQKIERYKEIDNTAALVIPDKELQAVYNWGKYNTDWLVRDMPTLGRGISAGMPDYPWFFSNDQAYTIKGALGTRDPQLFVDSWAMLKRESDKCNNNSGRIVHEMSSNGVVYDKGRMEESQEFIIAAWNIFKWTGDIEFLKTYYIHGQRVWQFLQENDKNNNLYIEGYGGTEIEGLNDEMLDVAVHTQLFLDVMAKIAQTLNQHDVAKNYADKAEILKKNINADWWIESEKRYGDFIASKEKTLQLIDMALEKRVFDNRNKWAKDKLEILKQQILKNEYTDKAYAVFYNTAGILPLSEGIADKDKAQKMLGGMDFFTNKFGLYIAGIARPDDIKSEEGSVAFRLKGEFNYNEAIMPAGTSKLILATAKYGTADKTLEYMKMLVNNFSFATPGSTYEVSPDYGMFVQAWNVCGINIPLIHYFFGISPMAHQKTIIITPNMPSKWEYAQLKNLLVASNKISVDFKKKGDVCTYIITSVEDNWKINFELPKGAKGAKMNSKPISDSIIRVEGKANTIEFAL